VFSFGAGVHAVLFANYDVPGQEEHCFSGIRRSYNSFVHTKVYGMSNEQYQEVLRQEQLEKERMRGSNFEEEMRRRLR